MLSRGSVAVALSVALIVVACGGSEEELGAGEVAESREASHAWGNYHWARTSNPFTLYLGSNVSAGWSGHLAGASVDWSNSTVMDTAIASGGTRPRTCKATRGRVEVCNERYGFNGWLGVATIWLTGSHIYQATVKLNDSYFNTGTYNTPEWRRMVMCQEIGHTFGLDHQDENFGNANLGTCMDYTSNPLGPPSNVSPNSHDFSQLSSIYQHLDTTTTVGTSATVATGRVPPQANDEADDAGDAAWGQLVRRNGNGKLEVYELDLGGGNKVRRYVIRP